MKAREFTLGGRKFIITGYQPATDTLIVHDGERTCRMTSALAANGTPVDRVERVPVKGGQWGS